LKPVRLKKTVRRTTLDYRVTYEYRLLDDPENFIFHVPGQLVSNVPANVPRALLPEFITGLIKQRSPQIGKIRNLRILPLAEDASRPNSTPA
jgi:hypothetical protein